MAVENNIDALSPRSQSVFGVTIAFFASATLFVVCRMLSRIWIVRRVSLDDYLILVAWVSLVCTSLLACHLSSLL